MKKKIPLIDGQSVDENFDLDNETDLLQLGLDPKAELKIADKYVHYKHCKHAVIELKSSSTITKAIKQIESTISRLISRGKKVDFAILVVTKINTYEQRLYKQGKDNILYNTKKNSKPIRITIGPHSWNILIFRDIQINNMYRGMGRYL